MYAWSLKKARRWYTYKYYGMVLDYSERRKTVEDMTGYIKDMLAEFPVKFKDKEKVATPAANHLFEAGKGEDWTATRRKCSTWLSRKDCSYQSEHDRIYIRRSRYSVCE